MLRETATSYVRMSESHECQQYRLYTHKERGTAEGVAGRTQHIQKTDVGFWRRRRKVHWRLHVHWVFTRQGLLISSIPEEAHHVEGIFHGLEITVTKGTKVGGLASMISATGTRRSKPQAARRTNNTNKNEIGIE